MCVRWNEFRGSNLGAAVGVEEKKWAKKNRGITQIESRGPDLEASAGVAVIIWTGESSLLLPRVLNHWLGVKLLRPRLPVIFNPLENISTCGLGQPT